MKRKLVATIACRNFGQRLFAKPLQNLDLKKNINVLNLLIKNIKLDSRETDTNFKNKKLRINFTNSFGYSQRKRIRNI